MPAQRTWRASFRRMAKVAAIFAVALLAVAAKPAARQSTAVSKERYLSPIEMVSSPDGRQLYITNAWSDTVSVIDTAPLQVVQTLPTGAEPSGVVSDADNTTLYVA